MEKPNYTDRYEWQKFTDHSSVYTEDRIPIYVSCDYGLVPSITIETTYTGRGKIVISPAEAKMISRALGKAWSDGLLDDVNNAVTNYRRCEIVCEHKCKTGKWFTLAKFTQKDDTEFYIVFHRKGSSGIRPIDVIGKCLYWDEEDEQLYSEYPLRNAFDAIEHFMELVKDEEGKDEREDY